MRGRVIALGLTTIGLAGCAGWAPSDGAPPGIFISGDDEMVRVMSQWPSGDLQPVAEAYCTARGRVPRLQSMAPNRVVYACLAPGEGAAP